MDRYARDDFDLPPTLNSGIAHVLLTKSAHHAWWKHPRLRPGWQPDDDRGFDLGTAAHAVLLEGRELFAVEFPDYRSKMAQAVRDEAKAAGKLPVLADQASDVAAMVAVARTMLGNSPDLADLAPLKAEQTCVFQQDGTWLRCRPDWITEDHRAILSYKTTRASAEPNAFLRIILGSGYHVQAAFELAGLQAVIGRNVAQSYIWLVQECEEPFACSLLGMVPEFVAFAQQAMRKAVSVWRECLARDRWPAYPANICYLDLPPWAQAKFMEQHGYEPQPVHDDGTRPIEEVMFEKGIMP